MANNGQPNMGSFFDMLNRIGQDITREANRSQNGRGVDHNDSGGFASAHVDPFQQLFSGDLAGVGAGPHGNAGAAAGEWPHIPGSWPFGEMRWGPGGQRGNRWGGFRRGGRRHGGGGFGRRHGQDRPDWWMDDRNFSEDDVPPPANSAAATAAATSGTAPAAGDAGSTTGRQGPTKPDRTSTAASETAESTGVQTPTTSADTVMNDNPAATTSAPDPAEVAPCEDEDPNFILPGYGNGHMSWARLDDFVLPHHRGHSCRGRYRRGPRGAGAHSFDLPHREPFSPPHLRRGPHHAPPPPHGGAAPPHPPPPPHGGPAPPPPPPPYSGSGVSGQGPFDWAGLAETFARTPFLQNLGDRLNEYIQNQTNSQTQRATSTNANDTEGDTFSPPIDVFNTEQAYVLHVSLPGARKEDVGVDWDQDAGLVRIAGVVHRPGDEAFLASLTSAERRVGMFERSVALPPTATGAQEGQQQQQREEIDALGITARMEDGILIVTVPKMEKEWTEIRKVDIE